MPLESASLTPWIALATFTFTTSITPGPNNLLLTVTGAHFGLRATVPAITGILLGMCVLIALASAGVASLLLALPGLELMLRSLGIAYLLWLSWKLCAPGTHAQSHDLRRPFTAQEAIGFQFANPKAWMMAVTAAAAFLPKLLPQVADTGDRIAVTLAMALCFVLIGGPCIASWAALGAALQGHLHPGSRLRRFNLAMGILLAVTALGMAWV